jgi:hypothetical protein
VFNCLNWQAQRGGKGRGRGGARRESCGGAGSGGGGRKKKGKGERGGSQAGPRRQRLGEKEKRKRRGGEVGRRAKLDGPLGPSGLKGSRRWFFLFFLSLFQTSFSNQYSIQIQIKPFKLFLKNFINFLETTQATKNHASQLMMHIHLLSLSLLNYI